jgi:hypothetical protein
MRHWLTVSLPRCHPVDNVPPKLPEAVYGAVDGSSVGNAHQVIQSNPSALGMDESIEDNPPL